MFNLLNLNSIRNEMISEIQSDIDSGRLYISDRLNKKGQQLYPSLLLNAAKSLDVDGFIKTLGMQYFNSTYPRKTASGEITNPKMPYNANVTLCEGEFNRFYIRAVCIKAISTGQNIVTVYRARQSDNPRPESIALDGQQIDANKLLSDLRNNVGVDTALGLPSPNSGMSVKL